MNKKHKTYSQFIGVVLLLIASAVGMGVVYQTARNRPPIIYQNLTADQVDLLNKLIKLRNGDGGVFTNDLFTMDDWNNAFDLGNADSSNWEKLEDANFIVYYKEDVDNKWKTNAELVLKMANSYIPKLEQTYGRYYYPKDMNGRKLPFYLPTTASMYRDIVNKLFGTACNTSGTLGMTIYHVSPSGFVCNGIVLDYTNFLASSATENSIYCTLPHEMTHYVYNASYDYNQQSAALNWVQEGGGDYFANRKPQVAGRDSISFIAGHCNLNTDFPEQSGYFTNNQYWAGESFFRFVRDKYGPTSVSKLLKQTYKHPVDSALAIVFPSKDLKAEWVNTLNAHSHLQHANEEEASESVADSTQMN